MIRYGPYEDGHDWTFDAKNYEDDMRNCYIDWDKKLIVAEEYTQEFKNSLCHYGTWRKINAFDYESVEDAVDAIFAAECFKGNIRRTVKTWSW